jgi:hypothetical protein
VHWLVAAVSEVLSLWSAGSYSTPASFHLAAKPSGNSEFSPSLLVIITSGIPLSFKQQFQNDTWKLQEDKLMQRYGVIEGKLQLDSSEIDLWNQEIQSADLAYVFNVLMLIDKSRLPNCTVVEIGITGEWVSLQKHLNYHAPVYAQLQVSVNG